MSYLEKVAMNGVASDMRNTLLICLMVLVSSSAALAADEYWDGDNLLACLVGKGAVEIRHGASAEAAIGAVRDECVSSTAEPEPAAGEEPEGDWGDYLDAMIGAAETSLQAIKATGTF